jgi:hypothetical protein
MAKYRLTREHYLQERNTQADGEKWIKEPQLHSAGEVVDWPGRPSLHMEGVDAEGKEHAEARQADYQERRKQGVGRTTMGWSRTFERNLDQIITRPQQNPDAQPQPDAGSGRRTKRVA